MTRKFVFPDVSDPELQVADTEQPARSARSELEIREKHAEADEPVAGVIRYIVVPIFETVV